MTVLSAATYCGLGSVLVHTNDDQRLQTWLVVLFGSTMYAYGSIQYALGAGKNIWGRDAIRNWRLAGWFFGVAIVTSIIATVVNFHLAREM